ncbi:MAG: hypothetical protein ACRC4M_05750 [Mycoplasma sp.]
MKIKNNYKNNNHYSLIKKNYDDLNETKVVLNIDKHPNHKFKKVTGSRFESVLSAINLQNNYMTPFQAWCILTGLVNSHPDAPTIIMDAGTHIEQHVTNYTEKLTGNNFFVFVQEEVNYDVFALLEIFGGIPDGVPYIRNKDGTITFLLNESVLEIKTCGKDKYIYGYDENFNSVVIKLDENNRPIVAPGGENLGSKKFFNREGNIVIPEGYEFQASLYTILLHLLEKKITIKEYFENYENILPKDQTFKLAFVLLETEDYLNPQNYKISKDLYFVKDQIIDEQKIKKAMKQIYDFYNNYVKTCISPPMMKNDEVWFYKCQNLEKIRVIKEELKNIKDQLSPETQEQLSLISFDLNKTNYKNIKAEVKAVLKKEKITLPSLRRTTPTINKFQS